MAVKKAKSQEVEVEVTPVIETPEVETPEEVMEQSTIDETPIVEVTEPEEEKKPEDQPKVEVDLESTEIKKPSGLVKIRMRTDHKCTIAMERYDLKAGKTYNVPENVKRILNKAGLLAPL